MPGSLTVRPAGNSSAINDIEDSEMRELVHELYRPFWNIWSGPFNLAMMISVFLLFYLALAIGVWTTGWNELETKIVVCWAIAFGICCGTLFAIRAETSAIRESRMRLAELMRTRSGASEAVRWLRKIEPVRTWFLKRHLAVPAVAAASSCWRPSR